jgi:hypothetical protein
MTSQVSLGKIVLTFVGIGTSVGGFFADFNETHLK